MRKSKNKALPDLVEFSMFTGVRRGEALALTWDRVDRARGVIRLELTKSGHRREVPLSSNADGVLARRWTPAARGYVFGSRNWNAFRSAWEAALAVASVEGFLFHDLRHTFSSRPDAQGGAGSTRPSHDHHDDEVQPLAPDHLRAAVAVLDGVLSSRSSSPPQFQRKDQRKSVSRSVRWRRTNPNPKIITQAASAC